MKQNEQKALELEALKSKAEKDYMETHISVLNYISALEEQSKPSETKPTYQDIFNYFHQEHGLTLLQTDIQEIERFFKPSETVNDNQTDAISFLEWAYNNYWILSSNDLWYYKSDGIIEDGISSNDLFKKWQKKS